jgi:hypothetical protein
LDEKVWYARTMSTIKIEAARANGILYPELAWSVSREVGVPFWVVCAFLEQESGGGRNIYGHDVDALGNPRPFWGHGQVTKENYEAYKKERDLGVTREDRFPKLGRRNQGVGPMQLTYWSLQDRADANGGCWDWYANVLTGVQIVKEYYDASKSTGITKWRDAAVKYSAKETYGDEMVVMFKKWQGIIL